MKAALKKFKRIVFVLWNTIQFAVATARHTVTLVLLSVTALKNTRTELVINKLHQFKLSIATSGVFLCSGI